MAGSKYMIPALCCLSLLCFSSSAIAGYDYFQFTLLWPGGYCHTLLGSQCCLPTTWESTMPALDFFVDGLKAYNSTTGEAVTNCNSGCKFFVNAVISLLPSLTPIAFIYIYRSSSVWWSLLFFQEKSNDDVRSAMTALLLFSSLGKDTGGHTIHTPVASIITDLFEYWSDVNCPSNNGLDQWKGAWCTYGNCTNFNQKTYFGNALNLSSNLNLSYHLKNQGIEPSTTTLYKLSAIQDALTVELGGPAIIECKKTSLLGNSEILKFTFCIDSDGKTLISCPFSVTTNCDEKVVFYPFTYDMLKGYDDSSARLIKLPFAELMAM